MTTRSKLTAGLVHDAVELTDDRLVLVRAFVAAILDADRRSGTARRIDSAALEARQAGELAEPGVGPDAAELGAVLARVACEVERATRLHGRTFPGGWGPAARPEDREARQRAQDACDAAQGERCASFRDVAEEEVAEVYAEEPGTIGHARELVQVAAVYVRGLLMAMTPEVPS